ncbi:MAG: efflux RND transporter periplasmic adaptor subunit [Pseudomonadota bacterium]
MKSALKIIAVFAVAAVVAGCGEDKTEAPERIRAIKPYYVVEPAGGDVRRYSGAIAAANTSALSFSVSGTVASVDVNQGDSVIEGQVLATLDPEPFNLNLDAARSELASAQADFENARAELDRQRQLYERDWVAKAAYDKARAAYEASEGKLNLARSRLGLAERDVSHTKLRAPFDGVISVRSTDPFVEVKGGDPVLRVDSEGVFEVDVAIPDAVVGRIAIGAPVAIDVTTIPGCGCTGRIIEIGAEAGAANAVPGTIAILTGADGLLPGMAAEVSIVLSEESGLSGFMAPIVAIAPGDETAAGTAGYVFKYDADAGVVRKSAVRGERGGVDGNLVAVEEGLAAGDIIAAAGVSFLRDGQRVKLMGE